MEVHVRNVPEQGTEKGLRNFLKPHLAKLSIRNVHCQKQRGKRFASLTFLNIEDGERFLAHHGQIKRPPYQGKNFSARAALSTVTNIPNNRTRVSTASNSTSAVNLVFLNQTIYCEKSNREANKYLLRVLEKEERDRQQVKVTDVPATPHDPQPRITKFVPITFHCSSASCGVWTYAKADLVYAPQVRWPAVNGVVKFGERTLILTFRSGQRIEFHYSGISNITMETGSVSSFIISMIQPPQFFESITDPLTQLMEQLNLQPPNLPQKRNGPDRHRLSSLGGEHEPISGICYVYRIVLAETDSYELEDRMHNLRKAHGLPFIIHRRTEIFYQLEPLATGFAKLQDTLSSLKIGFPFELKFQIQKLVQNNYLLPSVVIGLLPEITRMTERSPISVCISAIRKLFMQIPFPGTDIEAEQFQLESIVDLLRDNENYYNTEGVSLDEIGTKERSENVAIIHRVKITPSGTLLYGPEPENNNRVLRKYPHHHDYFLRVQFCDEDGQSVRFSSRVSLDRIFNGRFKKVLRDGIKIADRIYTFLGFSHSSLRAQTCWFMAPFFYENSLMIGQMLIHDLGDFSTIRSPAKCAARIGQTFSDTPIAVPIDPKVVVEVNDVEKNGRVFSDGVGTMSTSIMQAIWSKLSKGGGKPTCFQIRYAGTFQILWLF